MTSELFKYLNEQLSVFIKCEIEKLKSAKNIKRGFLRKNIFVYCNILLNTHLSFWKFLTFSFKIDSCSIMKFEFIRGAFLRNVFHNQNDYFTELKRTSKFKGFLKTTDQMHLPRTNRLPTRNKFEDQKNFEFIFWIKYDFQT